MRYPGGKGGAGVYQQIINLIPPHDVYIETHLGGGNIMERKAPAASSIGIDVDAISLIAWRDANPHRTDVTTVNADAVQWMLQKLSCGKWPANAFVYADPPYLMETRSSGPLYRHEYTHQDHVALLATILQLPCKVMISGYRSDLYVEFLGHWNSHDFQAMTRGGPRTETVWFNYERPEVPADLAHYGDTFRERERIKRKRQRWTARLLAMPPGERAIIIEALRGIASS